MRRELLFATVASVIIVAAVIIISLQLLVSPQYKPSIEIPPKPMPDFTLIDKDGREFSLSSVKGKPV
ncbi:MAG: hypothetical protein NZ938_04710, partial [Aigarchaeota archaeon]|nr:hypothetical protein [Candidatus Calditenuaceae archaeon]